MTVALNTSINLGAELVLQPRFELDALLKALDKKNVTIFPGVPTIYTAINNSPETLKHDLSSVRCCISGGAPLPVDHPLAFDVARKDGRIKPGDLVMFEAMGGGFTWGASLVRV